MNRATTSLATFPNTSHTSVSPDQGAMLADLAPERFDAIYDRLRELVDRNLWSGRASAPASSSALLEQAYATLRVSGKIGSLTKPSFFLIASRILRWIVVDEASRFAERRSVSRMRLLEVDRELGVLTRIDSRLAQIVELKFFGGLSQQQVARVLRADRRGVDRSWRLAQRWLYSRLRTL